MRDVSNNYRNTAALTKTCASNFVKLESESFLVHIK